MIAFLLPRIHPAVPRYLTAQIIQPLDYKFQAHQQLAARSQGGSEFKTINPGKREVNFSNFRYVEAAKQEQF